MPEPGSGPALRWILAIAWACFSAGAASAQDLQYFTFTSAPTVPRSQYILPGGEGALGITVHNPGTEAGFAAIHGRLNPGPAALAEYVFESDAPDRCLPPDVVTQLGAPSIRLRMGPLAAASSQSCSYRVRRIASSHNDLRFDLCGSIFSFPYCYNTFHFGTLPRLQFQVALAAPVEPGAATATVRLTIHNPGPRAVLRRVLTTECSEFGGGFFAPAPYEVETDFAGGCPRGDFGEICVNLTAQNFSSRHFAPGPIPAGGSASCLVRLRFTAPLSRPVSLQMHFRDEEVPFVDGGVGYDPGSNLATAPFGAAPTSAVPLGRNGLALMALLLALAGWAAIRRPDVAAAAPCRPARIRALRR